MITRVGDTMKWLGVLGFLLSAFAVSRVVSHKKKIAQLQSRLEELEHRR